MLSLILALVYPLAIQYKRGWWMWWVLPLTLAALVLDVVANYTELALLTWDRPQAKEYTFSQRLYRLQWGTPWQQFVAKVTIPYLNFFDRDHVLLRTD
jgi:hypothetical protein